jgi:hypothetical protein
MAFSKLEKTRMKDFPADLPAIQLPDGSVQMIIVVLLERGS